jgi:triacylglycerol lipase
MNKESPIVIVLAVFIAVFGLVLIGLFIFIIVCYKAIHKAYVGFDIAVTNNTICSSNPTICEDPIVIAVIPTVFPNDHFSKDIALFCSTVLYNFREGEELYPDGKINKWHLPIELIKNIKVKEDDNLSFGFVGIDSNTRTLYVFFRGTATNYDWMIDFQYSLVPFLNIGNNVLVHKGFYTLFLQLYNQVLLGVSSTKGRWDRIIVSGHSLGGSEASLIAFWLQEKITTNDVFCYTFGKPRVGNIPYANYSNNILPKRFWRLQNENDVVSQLPLSATPNLSNINHPYIYQHEGINIQSNINWESLAQNHSLLNFIDFIQSL